MRKRVCKDIFMILLLVTLFFGIFGNNHCCAISDVTSDAAWELWEPQLSTDSTLKDKTGVIVEFIKILGMIVSIVALSIIGIKYMLGSVEEKANYKQAMVPWVIGATMAFAIGLVPDIIYEATHDIINEEATMNVAEKSENGTYLEGYDDAIKKVYSERKNGNFHIWISEASVEYEGIYWDGYRQALEDLSGYNDYGASDESDRLTLATECIYDTVIKIEDGTYNPKNIAQIYQGIVKEAYKVAVPRKAVQSISLNRFLLQMDVGYNSVGEWTNAAEHLDDNYNEYYGQGLDDAYEWAVIVASLEEKEKIKTKMDVNVARVGIETGYQAGYNRGLKLFYDNMDSYGRLLLKEDVLKEKVCELKECITVSWQDQINGEEAAIQFAYDTYFNEMNKEYEQLTSEDARISAKYNVTDYPSIEAWSEAYMKEATPIINKLAGWRYRYGNKLEKSVDEIKANEKGYIYKAAYKSSINQIIYYVEKNPHVNTLDFIEYIKGYLSASKKIRDGTVTKDNISIKYIYPEMEAGRNEMNLKGEEDRLYLQRNLWNDVEYGDTPYTHNYTRTDDLLEGGIYD